MDVMYTPGCTQAINGTEQHLCRITIQTTMQANIIKTGEAVLHSVRLYDCMRKVIYANHSFLEHKIH